MELKLLDTSTGAFSANVVEAKDAVFAKGFNEALIHQVLHAYRASTRSGTKAQKTRAEVRGGGTKPWRQKGTGQARAGTIRSPLWRGGGIVFAAKPRDFSQKVNKKMYGGAMCSILSELIRQERLLLVDDFKATGKTRDLVKKLKELKLGNVLIVTESIEPNLFLAARNLPRVEVCDVSGINPMNLIGFEKVLMTVPSLRKIEEKLA
jgi:large subunit ribosomal protein L4